VANLVDNAIKHGRESGHVTVEVSRAGDESAITVRDDGPGIPSQECGHVLKRFYRLERSRRAPGNGLGLSLVAAVARLHGADIEMSDNAPASTSGSASRIRPRSETNGAVAAQRHHVFREES